MFADADEDLTDLACLTPYSPVLSDDPHMNSIDESDLSSADDIDAGERVLVDADTNMIGEITALTVSNKLRTVNTPHFFCQYRTEWQKTN